MVKWGVILVGLLLLFSLLQVITLRWFNPPTILTAPVYRITHAFSPDSAPKTAWKPLSHISNHVKRAVLAAEDQRFLTHRGFDFVELNEAFKDLATGRGFRGASTLSMQVARTVFLWPDRTWPRKILEAYYTVLLEVLLTKKRILEIYLNSVDWGNHIRGIDAAARKYFHVPSNRISREQAALLAAILPSPHRWSPTKPNARVLKRQRRILRDMKLTALPTDS